MQATGLGTWEFGKINWSAILSTIARQLENGRQTSSLAADLSAFECRATFLSVIGAVE